MTVKSLTVFAALMLALLAAGLWLQDQTTVTRVRFAAGPDDGEAFSIAQAISDVVEQHHPNLRVTVVETTGSGESVRLLNEGRVDFAAVQADIGASAPARLVAQLYPDVFQLVARADSGIESVADLVGRRIALPPADSGQYRSFWLLADHYGLTADQFEALPMSTSSANWALIDGAADAVFRVRAAGNQSIVDLIDEVPIRVIPIRQGAAMQLKQPVLATGTIPVGSYRGSPPIPASDLPSVNVQRVFIVDASVPDDMVNKITRTMFERRRELVALTPLAGFVSPPRAGGGSFIPVHPGAQQYYDRHEPSFLQQNAETIALVLTMAALLASGLLQVVSRGRKRRVDTYNRGVLEVGAKVEVLTDISEIDRYREQLFEIGGRVVDDAEVGNISPEGFSFFVFAWEMVNGILDRRSAELSEKASR